MLAKLGMVGPHLPRRFYEVKFTVERTLKGQVPTDLVFETALEPLYYDGVMPGTEPGVETLVFLQRDGPLLIAQDPALIQGTRWSFTLAPRGLVLVQSHPPKLPLEQELGAERDALTVVVREPEGLLPGAVVVIRCDGRYRVEVTDKSGGAVFTYCEPSYLEAAFPGLHSPVYEDIRPGATLLDVTLIPGDGRADDGPWLLHGDRLSPVCD